MDADRVLAEIVELMQLADAEAAKGGRLHKAGASAHGKTKAAHHEQMAELHAKIADAHASMADHYGSGAKGAHKDDAKKTDGADGADDDEPEKDDAKKASGYGALESIRSRPTRQAEPLTRSVIAEMFQEHDRNFLKSLVEVFRPPTEEEPDADVLAAQALLRQRGYAVEESAPPRVRKAVATDASAAPDKDKLGGDKAQKAVADEETEIKVLKAACAERDAQGLPTAAANAARERLDALGREEIRKAIRNPQVAPSGQMAGFRGVRRIA